MRLKCTKSKNSEHYSIIQDLNVNGKRTTKVYENIGNYQSLCQRAGDLDPIEWANSYVAQLNAKHKEEALPIILKKYENQLLDKNKRILKNVGYLFLQDLYYRLGMHNICSDISNNHQFKFDINNILSQLLYLRILKPGSKKNAWEQSNWLFQAKPYEQHQVYRSLSIIAQESDYIQAALYKNSLKYSKRNAGILYYDCTNYFFESEEACGLKQYGKSKENRPLPLVQMGLFLDGDGIPLAFNITAGNTNEQITLKPLEQQIISDFNHAKFIVCTDAGLSSNANRKFNNIQQRSFVTTQSIKKLKEHLRIEALDLTKGWKMEGSYKTFDISFFREELTEQNQTVINKYKDTIFYKTRYINENGLEQRLIVTYSYKYQQYLRNIRNNQVNRALKMIESGKAKLKKPKANDPKRFITTQTCTADGEAATHTLYGINETLIETEALFDGLYAVCTNIEDDVAGIIAINKRRWEIEESFRIMKTDFEARPVYLSRDDHIKAHFTTCFLALVIYRYLEKKLDSNYTVSQIINTLKSMEMLEQREGYIPTYERTELTDLLHEKFNFRTDYEISSYQQMKKIFIATKK